MDDHPAPQPVGDAAGPAEAGVEALDLDGIATELAAVESALERLDSGDYGRCAACGDPIGDDVLADDPTAATCAAHLRL